MISYKDFYKMEDALSPDSVQFRHNQNWLCAVSRLFLLAFLFFFWMFYIFIIYRLFYPLTASKMKLL